MSAREFERGVDRGNPFNGVRTGSSKKGKRIWAQRIGAFLALLAVAGFAATTFLRASEWSDPYRFAASFSAIPSEPSPPMVMIASIPSWRALVINSSERSISS